MTAGNISPPTNKLKNHLLFVLGLLRAIFSISLKSELIDIHFFAISSLISFLSVAGDLYLRTGFFSE